MEGIYYTYSGKDATRFLLSEKNKYLIGCFGSSPDNFSLWAYYADGFRGACIEIELDEDIKSYGIIYVTVEEFQEAIDAENEKLIPILTRKLSNWKLEDEIRVLIKDDNYLSAPGKLNKIGKITAVYFGINTGHKVVDWMEKLQGIGKVPPNISWGIVTPAEIKNPDAGSFIEILKKLKDYQTRRARLTY